MLKTKEEIIDWLEKKNIKNYTVNDDLTVDVAGNVDLSSKYLTEIPIKFSIIGEYFDCSNNQLTSLEGSPHTVVEGSFLCNNNELRTLKGSPNSIGGNFYCQGNELISLEGAPQEVGGNFYCNGNKLISLEGSPKEIWRNFYCTSNELTTLKGSPEKVRGDFYCQYNNLTSLEGISEEVGGNIIFSPMKELTYLDEYKNNDGHIAITFKLFKKIINSRELKEELGNTLIDKNVTSKKFKI